ncbi:MAG: prepilin-type N-terminal cleavage/methylation domain-containing protein [Acidobacteria bacterium]|nr:prepilin-type N-terminal cleavage/methylation domain-containing protein [Acidobacteriota bacterium]
MKNSCDQGFTLLELLIVVLVITLVMALSYPSLSKGSAALHLRSAGRDALNIFRYAREKAVTEQTGMRVVVDAEKRQFLLTNELGDGDRTYSLPDGVRIERMTFSGKEVTDKHMALRFLPNGSAEKGEVLLISSNGGALRVITDPVTGGARIKLGTEEDGR